MQFEVYERTNALLILSQHKCRHLSLGFANPLLRMHQYTIHSRLNSQII